MKLHDRVVFHPAGKPNTYISLDGVEGKIVGYFLNEDNEEFVRVDFPGFEDALCYREELTKVEDND